MLTFWTAIYAGILGLSGAAWAGSDPSEYAPLIPRQSVTHDYINGTNSNSNAVELSISTTGGGRNATAPLLYGWMIEDISHSIDGGLYGELVYNRAFQGSGYTEAAISGFSATNYVVGGDNPSMVTAPTLAGYRPIGGARLTLDLFHPLSEALPVVMEVDIPLNATGQVGFLNQGFFGMNVSPQTYNVSFYIKPNGPRGYAGNLTGINVSLMSNSTGDIWMTQRISASNLSTFDYTQLRGAIVNTVSAPDANNAFAITFDAAEVAGATFYMSLISLFPETFKDRPNGMRKDLARNIYDLGPKFLRFPGGNNIEGESVATRWIWNETIGPLVNRKGRPGDWGYYNTNGFGLLEFLEWNEDMEMEPLLAIYAGYSLDHTSYPEDRMGEVLQSALDELEYCMGDVSTPYGALRALHGHPDPVRINYVELGNEDWFSSTYPYRFPILYNGIKAAYPNLTLISTAFNESANYEIKIPAGGMWDTHHYEEPTYFVDSFNFWDNWQNTTNNENVTVFVGEYSNIQVDTPSGVVNFSFPPATHIMYPRLLSAISESVYLLGAERNPNVVKLSSYAPSLANLNDYQWTPNLITFTSDPKQTILSASYWSQALLNRYRGTETLPVTTTAGDFNPLYWVATIDTPKNAIYVKVINSGNQTVSLTLDLDVSYSGANGTIITGPDLNGFNYLNNQTAIIPVPITDLPSSSGSNSSGSQGNGSSQFKWNVPEFSISVLQFDM